MVPKGKFILGVDPGLSGALALYDKVTHETIIQDMPIHTDPTGKRNVDLYKLSLFIDSYASDIAFAVIEEVGGMVYTDKCGNRRGQGSVSSFNFGKAAGIVQGIVAASLLPILLVRPNVWKCAMGLSSDKQKSLDKAIDLFPLHAQQFSRKKDDGRAEALLLAVFAARQKWV